MHIGCFPYCGSFTVPVQDIILGLGDPLEVKITSSNGVVYYNDAYPDTAPFIIDLSLLPLNEDITYQLMVRDINGTVETFSFTIIPVWIHWN